MDDTANSRASDANATRKRRSSILKSHRPPRAPFSELEFNVATPTDTAKSRRVSFSRRTGVAEFVTNEATTTWKNFYEEHNKSLESSGNDSEANPNLPGRSSVGHLGKRIFDQQFQEVEAVDLFSTLETGRRNVEHSLNNVNLADQFAALECTTDRIPAPHHNYELSSMTHNQTKIFTDDLAISDLGEVSDRISVNFSVVQPISSTKDDLDEIEEDLERVHANAANLLGPATFRNGEDLSEYIEVDLNVTRVGARNEQSDMSITDTIHSPKVQDVSKSNTSVEKKTDMGKDWVADKENIAVNPYVAPKESANFAINEEPDKVLIFDGKRLTIQPEMPAQKVNFRQTLLPNTAADKTPQIKPIVLNVDDDLPNFAENPQASISYISKNFTLNKTVGIEMDLSMTQPLKTKIETVPDKRKTIIYENDGGDISMTQGVLPNILLSENAEKRKTILYENNTGDISLTQAVPTDISVPLHYEKRNTFVFEDDSGNLSITQAVSNAIPNLDQLKRTVIFESLTGDVSVTEVVSSNLLCANKEMSERRKTIVYENDEGDISVTKVVSANLIIENRSASPVKPNASVPLVPSMESAPLDISMTQAVPTNILTNFTAPERRRTVVFEPDSADISITRAIPTNIILRENSEKRKTIVFDSENADISMTQAILADIILPKQNSGKRQTIVFDQENADISITQAIPASIILQQQSKQPERNAAFEPKIEDISMTQALTSNIIPNKHQENTGIADVLMTEIATNNEISHKSDNSQKSDTFIENTENIDLISIKNEVIKRNTVIFEADSGLSLAKTEPATISKPQDTIYESAMDTQPVTVDPDNNTQSKERESNLSSSKTIFKSEINDVNVPINNKDLDIDIKTESIECNSPQVTIHNHSKLYSSEKMSVSKPIPADFIIIQKVLEKSNINQMFDIYEEKNNHKSIDTVNQEILVYQANADKVIPPVKTLSMSNSVELSASNLNKSSGDLSTTDLKPNKGQIELFKADGGLTTRKKSADSTITKTSSKIPNIDPSRSNSGNENPVVESVVIQKAYERTLDQQSKPAAQQSKETNDDKKVLDNLLDMSYASLSSGFEDKGITARIVSMENKDSSRDNLFVITNESTKTSDAELVQSKKDSSSDSLFVITKDSDNEDNKSQHSRRSAKSTESGSRSPQGNSTLLNTSSAYANNGMMKFLQAKLAEAKDTLISSATSRYNSILSPDRKYLQQKNIGASENKDGSPGQSVNANDTKEILKMLSKFTDKEEEDNPLDEDTFEELGDVNVRAADGIKRKSAEEFNVQTNSQGPIVKGPLFAIEDTTKLSKNMWTDDVAETPSLKDIKLIQSKNDVRTSLDKKQSMSSINDLPDSRKLICATSSLEDRPSKSSLKLLRLSSNASSVDDKPSLQKSSILSVDKRPSPPVQDKSRLFEPRRISLAARRQSVPLSREDLMSNISLAQAMLQSPNANQSASTIITNDSINERIPTKKMGRISMDVVKSLRFEDDESISEVSMKLDNVSPLKKTAFGESSYLLDGKNKKNVIPSYLKDVSDGIKQLMSELVKPSADIMPFETTGIDRTITKSSSTCSTQIQANLMASSQIDVTSPSQSSSDCNRKRSIIKPDSPNLSLRTPSVVAFDSSNNDSKLDSPNSSRRSPSVAFDPCVTTLNNDDEKEYNPRVILFDHSNPLNNILLGPRDFSGAHRYEPISSDNSAHGMVCKDRPNRVSNQYNVQSVIPVFPGTSTIYSNKSYEQNRTPCKNKAVNCYVQPNNKDSEVNTIIAMKGNEDLLEQESCLTLVDDMLDDASSLSSHQDLESQSSRVEVLYTQANKFVDLTSTSNEEHPVKTNVKRKHSTNSKVKDRHCAISSINITPKPLSKMVKMSMTPVEKISHKNKTNEGGDKISPESKVKESALYGVPNKNEMRHSSKKISPKRRVSPKYNLRTSNTFTPKKTTIYNQWSPNRSRAQRSLDGSSRNTSATKTITRGSPTQVKTITNDSPVNCIAKSLRKPGRSITVQKLLAEYHSCAVILNSELTSIVNEVPPIIDEKKLDKCVEESMSRISTESSRSEKLMKVGSPTSYEEGSAAMDWQPELMNELSSKNLNIHCESTTNVIQKIDLLPFMGSHECKWDVGDKETWSFLLLHRRLRLVIQLEDSPAPRPDTPVKHMRLDNLHRDKKNKVAIMCVEFAAKAIQHVLKRADVYACAGDVPALLRRCAGVARVALRWGRAMRDAWAHLAYTLSDGGLLTLKVANIPLRSVWEVTMQLELIIEDAQEVPWPCASNVQVNCVLSDYPVSSDEVNSVLSQVRKDWGHVPRSIWRIFKHLKSKSKDNSWE